MSNLLTSIFRYLNRYKRYSIINIAGLTVSISCFVIILFYVSHEFSYDKFHKNANDIYRVNTHLQRSGQNVHWAITNGYLVSLLQEEIPEVTAATKVQVIQSDFVFKINVSSFTIPSHTGFYADSNFFDLFNFKIVAGDQKSMLTRPNAIVLTASFANKLFGSSNIIGKIINIEDTEGDQLLKVTGILEDIPQNSHLQFDYLLSGSTSPLWERFNDPQKGGFPVYVYFSVLEGTSAQILQEKINTATSSVFSHIENIKFPIERLTELHFNNEYLFDHSKKTNLSFLYIITFVAFLILGIGCINYVILSTSQSLGRVKEIGIRKTQGASQKALFIQFLGESVVISFLAGIIAIAFTELLLHYAIYYWFDIKLSIFNNLFTIPLILFISVLAGIISGCFPAFKISASDIVKSLKGETSAKHMRSFNLRSALITVQFIFTAVMVIGSIVIMRQVNFLHNKNTGYNRDAVINVVWTMNIDSGQWNHFKRLVRQESQVEQVGSSMFELISDYNSTPIKIFDKASNDTITTTMQFNVVDEGFIPTTEMVMVEGRNFSSDISTDTAAVIINEIARQYLNLDTALHHILYNKYFFGETGAEIIGVVNDFHFQSFDQKIKPVMLILRPAWTGNLLIRVNPKHLRKALSRLETLWMASNIASPFEYSFVDDWYAKIVEKEDQQKTLMLFFAVLAVFVAMLGLFGLISYTLRTLKKEISIRKVFGASNGSILSMVTSWFLRLILMAFLIAIPLSYLGSNLWLQSFAYRIQVGLMDFIAGALLIFFIATSVIVLQSIRTSRINPAKALREE